MLEEGDYLGQFLDNYEREFGFTISDRTIRIDDIRYLTSRGPRTRLFEKALQSTGDRPERDSRRAHHRPGAQPGQSQAHLRHNRRLFQGDITGRQTSFLETAFLTDKPGSSEGIRVG